jgi:hypothetical protein
MRYLPFLETIAQPAASPAPVWLAHDRILDGRRRGRDCAGQKRSARKRVGARHRQSVFFFWIRGCMSGQQRICVHGHAGLGGRSHFHALPVREMIVYDSKVRAPICFDPVASRTVLPYHELGAKLAIEGNDSDGIARAVAMAYALLGNLPNREGVAFPYMWSADMNLGPGAGAWHPHMMIYAPDYDNSMPGETSPEGRRQLLATTPALRLSSS